MELVKNVLSAATGAVEKSTVDWTSGEKYIGGAVVAYVTMWIYQADWQAAKKLPLYLPFWIGALLIACSSATVGWFSNDFTGYVCGGIGGAAVFTSAVLHHSSTSLAILGAAILASIGEVLHWQVKSDAAISLLVFVAAVFLIGHVASTAVVVNVFGAGSTLPALLICGATCVALYLDPARVAALTATAAAALPFVIMKTSHPDYLVHKAGHAATSHMLLAALCVATVVCTATLHSDISCWLWPWGAAAVLALALAGIARTAAARPAALGPFYHYERRATVMAVMAIVLVAFEVATREDPSVSKTSFTTAAGLTYDYEAPTSTAIFYTAAGYAVAVALLSFSILMIDSLGLSNASSQRAATLDYLALCVLGIGACSALVIASSGSADAPLAGKVATAKANLLWAWSQTGLGTALSLAASKAPLGVPAWSVSWHLAMATAALVTLSSLVMTAMQRSTLLLAPLFAEATSRGSPRSKSVAITYTGLPSSEEEAKAVLAALASAGAKATFFVPSSAASNGSQAAIVRLIAAAGHEIGLLGLAGPHDQQGGPVLHAGAAALTAIVKEAAAKGANAASTIATSPITSPVSKSKTAAGARARSASKGGRGARPSSPSVARTPAAAAPSVPVVHTGPVPAAAGIRVVDTLAAMLPQGLNREWLGLSSPTQPAAAVDAAVVRWYRPQDASRDARTLRAAVSADLGVAYWSACPFDWDATTSDIKSRLVDQLGIGRRVVPGSDRGALDPTAVNGAIVCLHGSVSEYLQPSAAANRPAHNPLSATQETLAVLSAATGAQPPAFVTLSELCPNQGRPKEVLPVA